MRATSVALGLLLLALPAGAQEKTIVIIGDSMGASAVAFANVPDGDGMAGYSPYRMASVLQRYLDRDEDHPWHGAKVLDFTVGGSAPEDYYIMATLNAECVGANDPWRCCSGAGTGACLCDAPVRAISPWLDSACTERTPIFAQLEHGVDLMLIHTDGIAAGIDEPAVNAAVELIEGLIDAAGGVADQVLVSSPTNFNTLVGAIHFFVYQEMVARDMINGPDFFAHAPTYQPGLADGLHLTDHGYHGMAWLWFQSLPE